MKVMHNAPSDVRVKFWKFLEKEDKELVHLAYAKADDNDRKHYIGIVHKTNSCQPNSYDVLTYVMEADVFTYQENDLNYENALIEMGRFIRKVSYGNN